MLHFSFVSVPDPRQAKENRRQAEEAAQLRAARKLLREQRLAKRQVAQERTGQRRLSRSGEAGGDSLQQPENVHQAIEEEGQHSGHTSSMPLQSEAELASRGPGQRRVEAADETSRGAGEGVAALQGGGDVVQAVPSTTAPVGEDSSEQETVSGGGEESTRDGRPTAGEETSEETCRRGTGTLTEGSAGDGASHPVVSTATCAAQNSATLEAGVAGEGGGKGQKENGTTQQDTAAIVGPHSSAHLESAPTASAIPEALPRVKGTEATGVEGRPVTDGKATATMGGERCPGVPIEMHTTSPPGRGRRPLVADSQRCTRKAKLAPAVTGRSHPGSPASSQLMFHSETRGRRAAGSRREREAATAVVLGPGSDDWEVQGDEDYSPPSEAEGDEESMEVLAKRRRRQKKRGRSDSKSPLSVS